MNSRLLVVGLLGVNLVMLTAMLFMSPGSSTAYAQAVPQGGNYLMVTGRVYDDQDALYMIDLNSRVLHAFTIDVTRRQLEYRGARDLLADFGRRPAQRVNTPTAR